MRSEELELKIERLERENNLLRKSEATLRSIVKACSSTPVQDFLATLVNHIAHVTGVKYAFIGEAIGAKKERIRSVASTFPEALEYDLAGTPCETVFGQQFQIYNQKVWEQFPGDALLLEMKIECYVGVPLFNAAHEPIGLLVIMHDTPHEELVHEKDLLNTLARLAGSQLEHDALTRELIKAKETAEAASRIKNLFLANMSHEIRTPMTAILGFAELIQEDAPLHEDQQHAIQVIEKNGKRLLKLLGDILDIAKVESEHLDIHRETCSLTDIVEDAFSIFQPVAEKKGLRYHVDFDIDKNTALKTDPNRLNQILVNLIDNAIKFTPKGEVGIHVRDNRDAGVTIEVRDSGIGIAAKDIKKIFEPFSQADQGFDRRFQGAGLGLSICNHLAKLLGATLTVESRKNGGSTFSITFPTMETTDGYR